MQTLHYENNIIPLEQSRPYNNRIPNTIKNNWLTISPNEVTLHGMLLTSSFNIENTHQHLSINFQIKSFLKDQQLPFVEIFPQKGNIMRGQIKKVRIKFSKQYQPQISNNGFMMLKIYANLNTQWNKQYMMTNKLRGWSQIKDLPIEQYQVPLIISDQYLELKQNIRKSVVFESQFAKVSQDLSSLYGDQKFQVPQVGINSKNYLQDKNMRIYNNNNNDFERNGFEANNSRRQFHVPERRSMGSFSENKRSRSSLNNSKSRGMMKQVYFGNQPKIVQSKVEPNYYQLKRSRAESMSQKHNSPIRESRNAAKMHIPKVSIGINNPFSTQQNPFHQFSDRKLPPQISKPQFQSSFENHQDSSISILRSLERRNSDVEKFDIEKNQYNKNMYKNNNKNYENHFRQQGRQILDRDQQSLFKDFKTVDHHFNQPSKAGNMSNKRSMEIIVLAIIAGFFVALGSNIARLLH